jgi:hypothetical protein
MAKRIAIGTERIMVSPEALNRNVNMIRCALDLLKEEHPGFAIHVSAACNADLGMKEYVCSSAKHRHDSISCGWTQD